MSVIHSGFTITRDIAVPVERTFAAFADRAQKKAWFTDGPQWDTTEEAFDFRVGGVEVAEGQFHGGPLSRFVATYTDIVTGERIVLTYDMWIDGTHISTSVASYEFEAIDGGTRFTHTEHGVHLDGLDSPDGREEGTRQIIEVLAGYLENSRVSTPTVDPAFTLSAHRPRLALWPRTLLGIRTLAPARRTSTQRGTRSSTVGAKRS